jgi:hypothetical protein
MKDTTYDQFVNQELKAASFNELGDFLGGPQKALQETLLGK